MATENFAHSLAMNGFNPDSSEIINLRIKMGLEGFGLFLELVELLILNEKLPTDYKELSDFLGYKLKDYCNKHNLPYKNHYPKNKLKRVVEDFNFFEFDVNKEHFYLTSETKSLLHFGKVKSDYMKYRKTKNKVEVKS